MSETRAMPDDERPFIPEELVPRQVSEDPMRADGSQSPPSRPRAQDDQADSSEEDAIDVEDLP